MIATTVARAPRPCELKTRAGRTCHYREAHHLQWQSLPDCALCLSGQCSEGSFAFSWVGHPQPSWAGLREIFASSGLPQYEMFATTTRIEHLSQIAARLAQSLSLASSPSRRRREVADLAAAFDRSRQIVLRWQLKHPIHWLSVGVALILARSDVFSRPFVEQGIPE